MRSNELKRRMEEVEEGYDEAREEDFDGQFRDMFNTYFTTKTGMHLSVTEDDVQGFMDSFTFPSETDWCYDKVMSELDDIGDQQHEQMRDERCGL